MNKQAFELSPLCGWPNFKAHDDVVEDFFSTLTLRDSDEPWVYYKFTSDSSIWELDSEIINGLSIFYEKDNSLDPDESKNMPIQSISVAITPNENDDYLKLENLVQYLLKTYSLQKKHKNDDK